MDAKHIMYGETGLDKLVQLLRSSGQPQELTKLTERYLDILREMVLASDAVGTTPGIDESSRGA